MGTRIEARVIRDGSCHQRVGLSRRIVLEARRQSVRRSWAKLQVGMKLKGTVVEFGAFDLGGIDGLVRISEAFLEPR